MESDVDVTSLGIFLRKRVEEPTRRFVWTCSKKLKKREEKSSPMSDEYLEAEKERLRKSHANELFLSLSLSCLWCHLSLVNTLIFLSLRDDPPNPHFIPHITATFSAAKVC